VQLVLAEQEHRKEEPAVQQCAARDREQHANVLWHFGSQQPAPAWPARLRRRRSGFFRRESGQHLTMVLHIIGLILLGLLVGALGRLFHPGRDRIGIVMTMVIGVASVVIAGLLIGGLLGFILALVIGVVLVGLWSRFVESRRQSPKWKRALHVD
jgi:uncharacterized membrane protein YeaQ/YmgE (transglycosylase-associated protein family)